MQVVGRPLRHLHRRASFNINHPNVPVPTPIAGERNLGVIRAKGRLDVRSRVAGQLGDGNTMDGLEVQIRVGVVPRRREYESLTRGRHSHVEISTYLGKGMLPQRHGRSGEVTGFRTVRKIAEHADLMLASCSQDHL